VADTAGCSGRAPAANLADEQFAEDADDDSGSQCEHDEEEGLDVVDAR
jgi:hypothetical protein